MPTTVRAGRVSLGGVERSSATAEVVARYLFTVMRAGLTGVERVSTLRVRVWESPSVYAAYEGPLRGDDHAP